MYGRNPHIHRQFSFIEHDAMMPCILRIEILLWTKAFPRKRFTEAVMNRPEVSGL